MTTTKPKTKFYVGFSTDQEGRRPLVHKNHIPWWPIKCTDPRYSWEFAGLMSTLRSLCLKPLDGTNPNGWSNSMLQQIHSQAVVATNSSAERFF